MGIFIKCTSIIWVLLAGFTALKEPSMLRAAPLYIGAAIHLMVLIAYYKEDKQKSTLYYRMILDNISISYLVTVYFGGTSSFYGVLFQIILGQVCNHILLNNNKKLTIFFIISTVTQFFLSLIYRDVMSFKDIASNFIASGLLTTLLVISYNLKSDKKDSHAIAQKFVGDLIKHEIKNSLCILDYYIRLLDNESAQKIKSAISRITDVINDKIPADLYNIIYKVLSNLSIKHSGVTCEVNENTKISLNTELSVILLALYVFLDNAYESGATNIKAYMDNKVLIIQDNGSGFDTSKISLGYSTKNKTRGGGQGLYTTIELLKTKGIETTITSKIKIGTTVKIGLSEYLK